MSKNNLFVNLIAGGSAGFIESCINHPLDTVKTRMQLNSRVQNSIYTTGKNIIKYEGFFSLYKGLTPAIACITPKIALRFTSFSIYKKGVNNIFPNNSRLTINLMAGFLTGTTEAVAVVTPMDVCKIRLQAQKNRKKISGNVFKPKYTGLYQTAGCIIKEEGVRYLYKGLMPTIIRQGSNQALSLSGYSFMKNSWKDKTHQDKLSPFHHLLFGGISGSFGPLLNCPFDVAKTRLQQQVYSKGIQNQYNSVLGTIVKIYKNEGLRALWKGITPRLARLVPGKAIIFMVYEKMSSFINKKIL